MFRSKPVRILGIVTAVFLLLILAVKIFLPTEKIRDLALEQARAKLGREVSVGEVSVSLRGGLGVRLADFAIANPTGFPGEPLAVIQGVDLKLAIMPLLKGEMRVGRLVLDTPRINLVTLADGANNFTFEQGGKPADGTAGSASQERQAAVSVDQFSVRNGHLLFATAQGQEMQAEFTGLQGALSLRDPAPGQFAIQGDLKAEQMTFSTLVPAPDLPAEVSYALVWDNAAQRLDIQDLQGTLAGFPLSCQGTVQVAEAGPTTQVKGQAKDLDLAAVWALMKPMMPADQEGQLAGRGDVDLELNIPPGGAELLKMQGTAAFREVSYVDPVLGTAFTGLQGSAGFQDSGPGKFAIKGDVKAQQMAFDQLKPPPSLPAFLTYDLLWDNATRRLDFQNLKGTVAEFPLSAQGHVVLADAGPTTQLKGQARDIDLGKLWTLFKPMLPPEQKGELAGRGDLNLDLAMGPEGIDQLTYRGTAVFRKASYTETQLVDELQSMDAELDFTEKLFTVTRSDLVFNAGRFQLTGSLRDPFPYFLPPEMQTGKTVPTPHLEFKLRSPRLDVDRLIPAASPSGAVTGGPKGKPRQPVATLDMEFPDLTASGTFQADTLIYMQVPFTAVTGKVGIKNRVLTCSDVKGAVYGGQVDGLVNIDLKDLNDPTYGGTYQARDIEVDHFMQRFVGLAGVVFGGASMSGQFNAHGRDPDVIRNSLTLASDAQVLKGRLVTKGQVHGTLAQLASQTGHTLGGEQTLRDLVTRIKVDQGRVGLDNLSMKLGDWGDLKFAGFYSFTGNLDYSGNLLLTAEQTDRLFATGLLAELAKLLGAQRPARLDLPLTVGGTRADPKIKLDLGTVTSDLQKKALAEQKNKLEGEAKDKLDSKLNDLLKKWK